MTSAERSKTSHLPPAFFTGLLEQSLHSLKLSLPPTDLRHHVLSHRDFQQTLAKSFSSSGSLSDMWRDGDPGYRSHRWNLSGR